MSRYPERYGKVGIGHGLGHNFDEGHMDHCIDTIRQSLMCHADITPLVFQWSDAHNSIRMHGNVVHSCRNFDLIKNWALENHVRVPMDPYQRLLNDLVIPSS